MNFIFVKSIQVIGTSIKFITLVTSNMKSRMKGNFHVRFRENVRVKFPRVTRLCAKSGNPTSLDVFPGKSHSKVCQDKRLIDFGNSSGFKLDDQPSGCLSYDHMLAIVFLPFIIFKFLKYVSPVSVLRI